ncbi:hypothetical protein PG996_007587 [Apiospora saccharicola]|uniref:Uncharacterized protein n=1 Tax=Apiospora saccharicola TaxID=335842 RepID=A0ABR1VB92_9PEZI
MASDEDRLPLDLSLYGDDPDQDDLFCKDLLQALADGTRDPAEGARELDTWVMRKSTRRLEEFRARPELVKGDGAIVYQGSTPNASGFLQTFFQGFPRICTIFPSHSPGQMRIVEFLEALLAMPAHDAPDHFPDADDLGNVTMVALWPRGVLDPDTFRIYDAELMSESVKAELKTPGSEAGTRWRNYQSALARITMTGFSDCSFLCGLRDILPQSGKKAACPTPKWLVEPEEARWVYEQCGKKEKTDSRANPRDTWSKENWEMWKVQLGFYEGDDRVEIWAREAARKALLQMRAVEVGG